MDGGWKIRKMVNHPPGYVRVSMNRSLAFHYSQLYLYCNRRRRVISIATGSGRKPYKPGKKFWLLPRQAFWQSENRPTAALLSLLKRLLAQERRAKPRVNAQGRRKSPLLSRNPFCLEPFRALQQTMQVLRSMQTSARINSVRNPNMRGSTLLEILLDISNLLSRFPPLDFAKAIRRVPTRIRDWVTNIC